MNSKLFITVHLCKKHFQTKAQLKTILIFSFVHDHSVRVFPHLQDTGGFFIAVLQKVAQLPPSPSSQAASSAESATNTNNGGKGKETETKTESTTEQKPAAE